MHVTLYTLRLHLAYCLPFLLDIFLRCHCAALGSITANIAFLFDSMFLKHQQSCIMCLMCYVLLNRKVISASNFPITKMCYPKKESLFLENTLLVENKSIMNNTRSHNIVLIKSGCQFYYWSIVLLCSALSPVHYVPLLLMLFFVFCTRQFIWHIMCLSGMEAPELVQAELQPYVFLFITLS